MKSPNRILIVRLSALGDIVFATSMLDALKQRWPAAEIDWIAQAGFAGILDGDPRITRCLRLATDAFSSPRAFWRATAGLRAQTRYDLVIEVQGLFKSRLVARCAPAARRIGFDSKEPGGFWLDARYPKGGIATDIASEYRFLAEQLTGIVAAAPRLHVSAERQQSVDEALAAVGLAPGFVALCPFTTRPQKHWMEDYWGPLAERLSTAGQGPVAVFGGPGDLEAASRIMATLPTGSVNLAGKTRLAELPAWLARAGLVIGVDTGLTHIGIAVRRPTVALFGSTCPYTRGAEDAPFKLMYDALECSPCRRRPTCNGAFTCLRQLTPERVATAALELVTQA